MTEAFLIDSVVKHCFNPRRWAVCPNVSWSSLPWEADILAVSAHGKIHEIEVKMTVSDLAKDKLKRKWAMSPAPMAYVHAYWLAVPSKLEAAATKRAAEIGGGVIVVSETGLASLVKYPNKWMGPTHPRPNKVTAAALHRLAALRYWKDRDSRFGLYQKKG